MVNTGLTPGETWKWLNIYIEKITKEKVELRTKVIEYEQKYIEKQAEIRKEIEKAKENKEKYI